MKLKAPIHVMTIDPNEVALNQRRHMPPPNQVHQKKKGKGSYQRKKPVEPVMEM